MSAYYYLVSSLPMLRLGEQATITLQDFMSSCADWVSPSDMIQLEHVSLIPEETPSFSSNSSANLWYQWEICLRNKIVRQRASALNKDAETFTLHEDDYFSEIERGVQDAFSNANPMEREKTFDRLRWQQLENLESGHEFDFDKICIYKIKLMLLEKWQNREQESGQTNLDTILTTLNDNLEQQKQETT